MKDGFNIAAFGFSYSGLTWALNDNIPMGAMNVAIGMLLLRLGNIGEDSNNDNSDPSP